jgi:hypothetical protein
MKRKYLSIMIKNHGMPVKNTFKCGGRRECAKSHSLTVEFMKATRRVNSFGKSLCGSLRFSFALLCG